MGCFTHSFLQCKLIRDRPITLIIPQTFSVYNEAVQNKMPDAKCGLQEVLLLICIV